MLSSPYPQPPDPIWKALAVFHYIGSVYAGAWVLLSPPLTYSGMHGWVLLVWGGTAVVGGLTALAGVAIGRYKLEWPAVWIVAIGIAMYTILSWQAATEASGHHVRSGYMTALLVVPLARARQLSRADRAARERKQAEAEAEAA